MATHRLLAGATPIEGKMLRHATDLSNRGLVPYFVSGPLARSGSVGYLGTLLHVASWVVAIVFELLIMPKIDSTTSPAAYTLWLYGFVAITIGLSVLLIITVVHFFSRPENRVPEGGLPPFLMTLFIGGAQISMIFSMLQLVFPATATDITLFRLTAFSMMFKVYIVQFLRNNQEWAGPANELKKLSMEDYPVATMAAAGEA